MPLDSAERGWGSAPPKPAVPAKAGLAERLVALGSSQKMALAMLADAVVFVAALTAAVLLIRPQTLASLPLMAFAGAVAAGLLPAGMTGCYRAVVRFVGPEFLLRLGSACLISAVLLSVMDASLLGWTLGWRTCFLFGLLSYTGVGSVRVLARLYLRPHGNGKAKANVLIYGAGDAGQQLLSALQLSPSYRVVGFADDDRGLRGRLVRGLRVRAPGELAKLRQRQVFSEVLLALPSISRSDQRRILELLEPLAVKVMVMPGLDDLASGRKRVDELREVQIEDVLGREAVAPMESLLDAFIRERVVMVTGAGGSIGSELCRLIAQRGARKIVLFEISEPALYQIERNLAPLANGHCELVPVLGDVTDAARLRGVIAQHAVETIYHAAAYKHVPLVERNAAAAIRNNVFGTLATAEVALAQGVHNFVLVSTDKAVRPTSVMGASKRVCELVVQAMAERYPKARVSMVRFGNVLGSSGSVVPLFLEQIRNGGPVTVTHPDVTRYFMTLGEAAQLVVQAGAMGSRGEVFLLDMGTSVRIQALAERMIHLSGLSVKSPENPDGEIEVQYTGLRPGEKLYEELLIGSNPRATPHPRVYQALEASLPWLELEPLLDALAAAVSADDSAQATLLLRRLVPGFAAEAARPLLAGAAAPVPALFADTLPPELQPAAASASVH